MKVTALFPTMRADRVAWRGDTHHSSGVEDEIFGDTSKMRCFWEQQERETMEMIGRRRGVSDKIEKRNNDLNLELDSLDDVAIIIPAGGYR